MTGVDQLLEAHLGDPRTGWSMGTFGAIAEFHQDEGEPVDFGSALERATSRGAIRIDGGALDGIVPVAYETLSPKPRRWSHTVSLCLPEGRARRACRTVLTELGPDTEAVRDIDRTGVLFDMGLSLPQCDFCIRTGDPALIAALRASLGRSLFEPGNAAMSAILPAHPHRVAVTNIGRVEVYQKIGGPDTGGVSPPGPHTHILPQLLRTGRTHSAKTPIPGGLLPLGALHPGNPVIGPMGEERTFDRGLHDAFQGILDHYGDPAIVKLKRDLAEALRHGGDPRAFATPRGRFERASVRVALRQQARFAEQVDDPMLMSAVAAWREVHDRSAEIDVEEDDAPGHG